jgi:hypothetical protein
VRLLEKYRLASRYGGRDGKRASYAPSEDYEGRLAEQNRLLDDGHFLRLAERSSARGAVVDAGLFAH